MRCLMLLVLAGLVPGAAVRADEITDQLDQVRKYYQAGDIAEAIDELEFLEQAMQGKLGRAFQATFPLPPRGWTVERDDKPTRAGPSSPVFGGTMLQRTYRQNGGHGSIRAQLIAGGSFLQGLATMLMNPQVLAAQPNARRIRVGRESGVVTFDPGDRSGQLMLDLGGKVSITLEGSGLEGEQPMLELAQGWDLKKVKALAGS